MMRLLATSVLLVGLGIGVVGQTVSNHAAGAIIGTGAFTVFVENMDRSLAFYHDMFGMDVSALPVSGERPYNRANPRLFAMFDIPGARERHQSARIAGTRVAVEVMEIQDVAHHTLDLRVQDPGCTTLVLAVRDIDAMLARLAPMKTPIVTMGNRPVALADGSRAILIRDVDNRLLELVQPASPTDTQHDVIDMSLSIAVNDLTRTVDVYRGVLGFDVTVDKAFVGDRALRGL